MIEEVKKILESSKKAYRESVVIDNEVIEEELLTIIGSAKYLLNKLENDQVDRENKLKSGIRSEADEIQRVHRRVRLWRDREHQYNHRILTAYMELSNNNKHSVSVFDLERQTGINDSQKFHSHFNGMKMIAEKNHGKVFSELDDRVLLWEPIADVVIEEFSV